MLGESVRQSCHCETVALTDTETVLPVLSFQYETKQPRLMLWILEVILSYLDSPKFDQDTVMVSPDTLVYKDLSPYFAGDITILVRTAPHYAERPILNAVQWWRVKSKRKLVRLYTDALAMAQTLPDDMIRWGADTETIVWLLGPIAHGVQSRHGIKVSMIESRLVMQSLAGAVCAQLDAGEPVSWPVRPIVDFKYLRKRYLQRYYDATLGAEVSA